MEARSGVWEVGGWAISLPYPAECGWPLLSPPEAAPPPPGVAAHPSPGPAPLPKPPAGTSAAAIPASGTVIMSSFTETSEAASATPLTDEQTEARDATRQRGLYPGLPTNLTAFSGRRRHLSPHGSTLKVPRASPPIFLSPGSQRAPACAQTASGIGLLPFCK